VEPNFAAHAVRGADLPETNPRAARHRSGS